MLPQTSNSSTGSSTPIADALNSPVANRVRGLELDLRLREFEISQLTQRNNFFMIFQGVMIGGLIQSQGLAAPILTSMTSLLGMAVSILQIGMAGGAKYWQSRWNPQQGVPKYRSSFNWFGRSIWRFKASLKT